MAGAFVKRRSAWVTDRLVLRYHHQLLIRPKDSLGLVEIAISQV